VLTLYAARGKANNMQADLFGEVRGPPYLDYKEQVEWVMERYPGTRDSDAALAFIVWMLFYNSPYELDSDLQRYLDGVSKEIPGFSTLARRRREVQQLRYGNGKLEPSKAVKKRRKEMDSKGPVR